MPFRGGAGSAESLSLYAQRLGTLFDRLPALIGYWDRDERNVMANAAYIEWFGRDPDQMPGTQLRDVLGAEVYAKNLPFITGALEGHEQHFDRTLVDTLGRTRHTQASYVPDVVDDDVVGFFVLVTDVTARVEAQRAMDDAQRLAEVGSWSVDLGTGAVAWSDQLFRLLGLDPAEVVPSPEVMMAHVDDRDLDAVGSQIEEARLTGRQYELSYRIHRADGEMREVFSRGRPQTGSDGSVVRLAGTLQDVTATNAAARELSRVNVELRKVNRLNADVVAMLGHDVRAPLAVVLGYLEELVSGWDETSEPQRRAFADRAFSSAGRLRTLIDDILSMASIESGQVVAHPGDVSLLDEVRSVMETIPSGEAVQVTVSGAPRALADPFHVRQVVANVVTNALRYGAPPIEVHLSETDEAHVTITVTDHGAGVPESEVASLFERFVAHGSPGQAAGASSGFGLYVSAGLAAASHGTLDYDPSGPGACFRLVLPRA